MSYLERVDTEIRNRKFRLVLLMTWSILYLLYALYTGDIVPASLSLLLLLVISFDTNHSFKKVDGIFKEWDKELKMDTKI